jgi:diacylglycerol kinase family enzyme
MKQRVPERTPVIRRLAAGAALGASALAAIVIVGEFFRRPLVLPILVLGLLITMLAGWMALITRGVRRTVAAVIAVAVLIGLVIGMIAVAGAGSVVSTILAGGLVVGSNLAARFAFRHERALVRSGLRGHRVRRARHGVLLMNPRSGNEAVTRLNLVDEARRRGIEPVLLAEGDDLRALAESAIGRGADVIGMAGGDGSQALVADVARTHNVPFVCVPAGTRNHFALDLGLDRADVVGALDAFGDGVERRVDLATVGGRVFVNNASLGLYATIVSAEDYRDAKWSTALTLLPDLIGPGTPDFDLAFDGPDTLPRESADVLLVSNNPYVTRPLAGAGTRPRLDTGLLGIVAIRPRRPDAERTGLLPEIEEWAAATFRVNSAGPVPVGVDGEALELRPPLEFLSLPAALRVRLPRRAPGASHTAVYGIRGTVAALVRVLRDRED